MAWPKKELKMRKPESLNMRADYKGIFPLEGEETKEDLQHIWNQLAHLGIGTPEFWMDADGKDAGPHFSITVDDVKNGTWVPKRKELIKDILRYFEIRTKFNC